MLSGQIGSCDTKDSGIVSGSVKVYLDQVCSSPVFLSAYFCSGLTVGQGRSSEQQPILLCWTYLVPVLIVRDQTTIAKLSYLLPSTLYLHPTPSLYTKGKPETDQWQQLQSRRSPVPGLEQHNISKVQT